MKKKLERKNKKFRKNLKFLLMNFSKKECRKERKWNLKNMTNLVNKEK